MSVIAKWDRDEILRELFAERWGPTDRDRPSLWAHETAAMRAQRCRVLNESMEIADESNVVPMVGRNRNRHRKGKAA
jgi:hypothetical protein